jgi:hypothetical protein
MLNDVLRNFDEFGRSAAWPDIPVLRFVDGEYRLGIDNEVINLNGIKLTANMPSTRIGWTRYECGFPVKEVMGYVIDNFQPPPREELGDDNKSLWGTDDKGNPKDPWRRTYDLVLWDPRNSDEYGDDAYCLILENLKLDKRYPTGLETFGILCQVYAAHMRLRAAPGDDLPVIELTSEPFKFGGPKPGIQYLPRLNVIGWTSDEEKQAAAKAAYEAQVLKFKRKRAAK